MNAYERIGHIVVTLGELSLVVLGLALVVHYLDKYSAKFGIWLMTASNDFFEKKMAEAEKLEKEQFAKKLKE